MRRLSILLLAIVLCGASSCTNKPKPSGPALVYVLRVSYPELLIRLSDHSTDSAFRRAVHIAAIASDTGSRTDFLTVFAQAYHEVAPSRHLASVFAYVPRYQRLISGQSTDDEIMAVLRQSFAQSLDQSTEILRKRFEVKIPPITWRDIVKLHIPKNQTPYVGEVTTRLLKSQGVIEVSVTGADDPDRIRKMMLARGDLGLWDTYENEEIYPMLMKVDQALATVMGPSKVKTAKQKQSETKEFFKDAVVMDKNDTTSAPPATQEPEENVTNSNPLFMLLNPMANGQGQLMPGPAIGMAFGKDTATVDLYISLMQRLLPNDLRLMWSLRPLGEKDVYELYAIRTRAGQDGAPISGGMITDARQGYDYSGQPDVTVTMSRYASAHWEAMTDAAAHGSVNGREAHRCIAITLDDRVVSVPRVMNKIAGGNTEISGIATVNEAIDLADILRNGPLPAPMVLVEERIDSKKMDQ
ncbi:MAG: hypothetical protein JST90_09405 [Bacteroidetes bacterium]|nr:hypothetical protein [Bacteroidota bacterium]